MNEKQLRAVRATKRKIIKSFVMTGAALAVFGILAFLGTVYLQKRSSNLPGVFYRATGRAHIPAGTHQPNYNSNPPTSGNHYAVSAEWGVYSKELPDETLIHNLEHGGIWISYRPDIPEEVRKALEEFYAKWGRKIIVAPRADNDADIALAAWERLDKFSADEFSKERVERFIEAYRNKGPEFVP